MIEKKEDNIRSESYYPDSNYYLDQDNSPKENLLSEDQISKIYKFDFDLLEFSINVEQI